MGSDKRLSVLVILAHSKYRQEKPPEKELPIMLAGNGFDVLVANPSRMSVTLRLGMAIAADRPCQAVIVERLPGEPRLHPKGEMAGSLSARLPVYAVLVDPDRNKIMGVVAGSYELVVKAEGISDADLPERLLNYIKDLE